MPILAACRRRFFDARPAPEGGPTATVTGGVHGDDRGFRAGEWKKGVAFRQGCPTTPSTLKRAQLDYVETS
jgi:hypothetical protein